MGLTPELGLRILTMAVGICVGLYAIRNDTFSHTPTP